MNAADLIKSLEGDPTYQAMLSEKRRRRAELEMLLSKDEAPLIEALAASGIRLESIWDLVNSARSYPNIIEVLADHITRPYHFRTREGIARLLTVKEARGTRIPRVLMEELKRRTSPETGFEESYRSSLVNALRFVGDRSLLEEVSQLIADRRYGSIVSDLKHLEKVLSRKSRSK